MTQNNTIEAGTGRQREERKELERNENERLWEDKRDFSFLNPK
jgi:hypothetical protein